MEPDIIMEIMCNKSDAIVGENIVCMLELYNESIYILDYDATRTGGLKTEHPYNLYTSVLAK